MRVLGMSVIGLVSLFASSARADLPLVKEAHAAWNGCDYALRVEEDVDPIPYPRPLYRISVRSTVVSADTCTLTPGTVELNTSKLEPKIALAANEQGLAVAYSAGAYVRATGPFMVTYLHRLNPASLATTRQEQVSVGWTSAPGYAGGPGTADPIRIALYPTHLELKGVRDGNLLNLYPGSDYRFEEGTGFAVFYSDFFGVNRKQPIPYLY